MERIRVQVRSAPYDVLLDNNILQNAGDYIVKALDEKPSQCVVVTSRKIFKLHGLRLKRSLAINGLKAQVIEIQEGETRKNLDSVAKLVRAFAEVRLDRASLVVALGGGVIGDIAGFAASIYMRGIPVVQVPTTLLAQVDAAIGGKTGVNLAAGKNFVGTFHQPKLVIIDPRVLKTLNEREFRAGLFEVIKCGIIRDSTLFEMFESDSAEIVGRDELSVAKAILRSVRVKAEVVALDEREGDLRRILNFGHTIGHALEAEGGYKDLLHGEAVGLGMIAAICIGEKMGVTPSNIAKRLSQAVLSIGRLPAFDFQPARVLKRISSDKKTRSDKPNFVLIKDIGQAVIASDVPEIVIKQSLQTLRDMNL